MGRSYAIYDVFTERPLAGNPLGVVFDADGLATADMQAIARELNLSETVFVDDPDGASERVRVRIFTPGQELPFAGHPTVGAAVAVAQRRGVRGRASLILEEGIGDVAAAVEVEEEGRGLARFALPKLAEPFAWHEDVGRVAAALGLAPSELGFDDHRCSAFNAGLDYFLVPVRDRSVIERVSPDPRGFRDCFPGRSDHRSVYVYCRDTADPSADFHARMLWWLDGVREDPATGSAAAAFVGAVITFERPTDGTRRIAIEQGVEMGRPSRITLEIDVAGGRATAARIAGHAVRVAVGELHV